MDAGQKPLLWLHREVKTPPFSAAARVEAGVLLGRLQRGEKLSMPASRPMPVIGAGCHELRITDRSGIWRIVYFTDSDAIDVLDVFAKKSNQTPSGVVDNCKHRLRSYKSSR